MENNKIKKFRYLINRQRISPKIYDYSYILLKNNLRVFRRFKDLIIKENKIKILDVGCGFKSWQSFFNNKIEYIGVDLDKKMSTADFIGSAEKLPFKDNEFDALIYSEILEHIGDLPAALREMHRVAKNGTLVFISSPYIFPEHGLPYDFQRLTKYYYQKIFENDEIILIKESNSSLSTCFICFNLFIESSPFRIFNGLKHLIYIFNNLTGIVFDKIIEFVFSKIGKNYKKYFYLMPLGYALIIRIRK
jgi:SAM-dependent methyltransferase